MIKDICKWDLLCLKFDLNLWFLSYNLTHYPVIIKFDENFLTFLFPNSNIPNIDKKTCLGDNNCQAHQKLGLGYPVGAKNEKGEKCIKKKTNITTVMYNLIKEWEGGGRREKCCETTFSLCSNMSKKVRNI